MCTDRPAAVAVAEDTRLQVALTYLSDNDFTSIRRISRHLLAAMDGDREVLVWFNPEPPHGSRCFLLPLFVFELAETRSARVDLISMKAVGDLVHIRHMMNA